MQRMRIRLRRGKRLEFFALDKRYVINWIRIIWPRLYSRDHVDNLSGRALSSVPGSVLMTSSGVMNQSELLLFGSVYVYCDLSLARFLLSE